MSEPRRRRVAATWRLVPQGRAATPPIPRYPLDRTGLLGRGGPFLTVLVAALVFLAVFDAGVPTPMGLGVIGIGLIGLVALVYFVPWHRMPRGAQTVAPVIAIALIAVMRDTAGGPASGISILFLAPVVWVALYGTPEETAATMGAIIVAMAVPAMRGHLFSGAVYVPQEEWRRIAAFALVGSFLAVVVYRERRQGTSDALTGLANRRAWDEALCHAVGRAHRTGEPLSVAILDLDHFKAYNDLHGHAEGDRVLGDLARAWAVRTRPSDVVARVGGEEFAILYLGSTAPEAVGSVDRLRGAVPPQTFSAGVAAALPGERAEELMRRADAALYTAKERGRDRTVVAPVP
jgi:diguanylate cyclase (GGDEF)-like protein